MGAIVRSARWASRAAAAAALLALVACALPQRLMGGMGGAPSASTSSSPSRPTANQAPASTSQTPPPFTGLPSPAAARPLLVTPPIVAGPPVPPQIAANFPEPPLDFATPAFGAGRTAYTTNDELHAILRGLRRSGSQGLQDVDIALLPLGSSQSGVPIEALAFTRASAAITSPVATSTPAPQSSAAAQTTTIASLAAEAPARRPSVLLLAGQHGDEPAGTETLVVIAQDIAAGRFDRLLDQIDIYILPRVNPDGAALGQRDAVDGTDVNRDHLLLHTPEAAAVAQLVRDVAPLVVLDLHEYAVDAGFAARFGAVQRFDALLQYATVANEPAFVTKAAEEWFRVPLLASLSASRLAAEWYYTVSEDLADRKLTMGGVGPAVGRNAQGLKNVVSLLVETRGRGIGRTDLKRRVQTGVVAVGSVLGNAAAHAGDLLKLRQFVERDVSAQACRGEAVLDAAPTSSEHVLAMIDANTGAIRRVTVAWESALELRVLKSRPRPCGYWLAASESDAVRRLRQLGVEVQQLDEAGEVRSETYRPIAFDAGAPGPAGQPRLRVQTQPVLLDMPAGGYFVSLAQPLANLAIAALEPESVDGYAANHVIADVRAEARVLARPGMRTIAVP